MGAGGTRRRMAARYPWGERFTPDHANYDRDRHRHDDRGGHLPEGGKPLWRAGHERQRLGVVPDEVARAATRASRMKRWRAPTTRVLRGGAFDYAAGGVRCASRHRSYPDNRHRDIGFRVVASPIIHDSEG